MINSHYKIPIAVTPRGHQQAGALALNLAELLAHEAPVCVVKIDADKTGCFKKEKERGKKKEKRRKKKNLLQEHWDNKK